MQLSLYRVYQKKFTVETRSYYRKGIAAVRPTPHINYLLITKGPTDVNIVQILHLSNSFESKHWFTSAANQLNSVRYSVGTSYFTKHKSSKYIQSICSHQRLFYPSPSRSKSWVEKQSWRVGKLQSPIWTGNICIAWTFFRLASLLM